MIITSLESFQPTWQRIEGTFGAMLMILFGIFIFFNHYYDLRGIKDGVSSVDRVFSFIIMIIGLIAIGVGVYLLISKVHQIR